MHVGPGHVDLWKLPLQWAAAGFPSALLPQLSGDELLRAGRAATPALRRRRALRRAWLRIVLSRYTDCPGDELRFRYGAYGKPRLVVADPLQPDPVHFNASASCDWCIIGVAAAPVGVDVEQSRPLPPSVALPGHMLDAAEADLEAVPGLRRSDAFLERWTANEALVKATGEGLSADADTYQVMWTGGRPHLTAIRDDDPHDWTLGTRRLDPDLIVSLAVRTPAAVVTLRTAASLDLDSSAGVEDRDQRGETELTESPDGLLQDLCLAAARSGAS